MNAAKEFERQQQFESAAREYAAGIALDPLALSCQDGCIRGGRCLEKVNKFNEAVAFYDTAVSIAQARSDEAGAKGVLLQLHKRYALFARAAALEKAGNEPASALAYQTAVDAVFADLSAQPASATMRQDAAVSLQESALQAGLYLQTHGKPDQAQAAYDHVIAIGDARATTADGENTALILDATCDGLFRKAVLCQSQNCVDEARQAIFRLKSEFPPWRRLAEASVIEAQIDNRPTQEAEFQVSREREGFAALDQALRSPTVEQGLAAADQIIAQFGDTTAAVATLEKKARVLDGLKRIDEARAAYVWVLDRLRPLAPRSEIFQTARVKLKRMLAHHLIAEHRAGRTPPNAEWEQVRALSYEIAAQDTRPEDAAQARVTVAESYIWQKQYPEALAAAEQFLAEHDPQDFIFQTIWAHFFASMALEELGYYGESLEHLRWVKANLSMDTALGKQLIPFAHIRILDNHRKSGAPDDVVLQAKEEFRAIRNLARSGS